MPSPLTREELQRLRKLYDNTWPGDRNTHPELLKEGPCLACGSPAPRHSATDDSDWASLYVCSACHRKFHAQAPAGGYSRESFWDWCRKRWPSGPTVELLRVQFDMI